MTLTLRAVALNGSPLMKPIEARFAPPGGTVGRSSHNMLTLPDPDRHISRTQVEIVAEDDGCVIKNIGSANPILVRGRTLAVGESMPLVNGDRLRIGGYSLDVLVTDEAHAAEPALAAGEGAPKAPAERNGEAALRAPPRLDDWPVMDPVGDSKLPVSGGYAAQASGAFGFDEAAPARATNPFADLLGDAASTHSTDPLADFFAGQRAAPETQRAEPRASSGPSEAENGPAETLPGPFPGWPADRIDSVNASLPPDEPSFQIDAPVVPTLASADTEAMWRAFCEGARIHLDLPEGASPELMRVAGNLLRTAIEGTLQLVEVRSALRYELHAAVTVIKPRNNNPLKFAPDPRSALEQLLQPPLRGFLPGPAAMTDVMNDLVGHAIGTMAGTRAALEGVLARFAPAQLEAQLADQSVLDSVLPMNRKSKLWELYLLHYEGIRDEAQEDFHTLFGKAFLEAYDQQLERLRREKASGQR